MCGCRGDSCLCKVVLSLGIPSSLVKALLPSSTKAHFFFISCHHSLATFQKISYRVTVGRCYHSKGKFSLHSHEIDLFQPKLSPKDLFCRSLMQKGMLVSLHHLKPASRVPVVCSQLCSTSRHDYTTTSCQVLDELTPHDILPATRSWLTCVTRSVRDAWRNLW